MDLALTKCAELLGRQLVIKTGFGGLKHSQSRLILDKLLPCLSSPSHISVSADTNTAHQDLESCSDNHVLQEFPQKNTTITIVFTFCKHPNNLMGKNLIQN